MLRGRPSLGAAARAAAARRTAVHRDLAALADPPALRHRDGPIVVGPWASEVGFEVLYWRPALARMLERTGVDPARLTVVSRGGAESWYAGMCGGYADLLDVFTPEELRGWQERRVAEGGLIKQRASGPFDDEVLRRLAGVLPTTDPARVLHPSTMYRALGHLWAGRAPLKTIDRHLAFRPMAPPAAAVPALPDDFVAVKAYFSANFPDTPANRAVVAGVVRRLAERSHVVVLSTGLAIDDHTEMAVDLGDRVHDASAWMTPRDNLGVQTAIIGRARALVTTYGGFSYLGPFLGVPTVALFSDRLFVPAHLEVAHRAVRALGDAVAFTPVDVRGLDLLGSLLGDFSTVVRPLA